ncbi:hypothetical protein MUK42_16925 [Musa troglodytarum]|uniref:Uncharacterized protein n=1 Tax=Musa troglodytarum TaxID=320322 RepID=A0A9E7HKP5_9LILI|nr:hypothetical protein MUK42_16925 [Musa troglodytarum]
MDVPEGLISRGFHRADRVRHCLGREHRLDPRAVPVACRLDLLLYREENSTTSGILYVVAVISMFDEFTNDFLYLREGSCFPSQT